MRNLSTAFRFCNGFIQNGHLPIQNLIIMKDLAFLYFKKYKIDIIVWLTFICYETLAIGLVFGIFGHPLTYLTHYLVAISLFYIHANVVMPWTFTGKVNPIWKAPILIAIELWSYILISFLLDSSLIAGNILDHPGSLKLDVNYHLKTLYRGLLFSGFASGYYFLKKYNREKERSNELEKQHLKELIYRQHSEQQLAKAENDYLKAQINPHFLFNTLDFIYHSILNLSPVAANTIIALADMMRFAIDADKTGGYILLGDEAEQVEHLIYLNQLRKKSNGNIDFSSSPLTHDLYIIPLVLLTLGENIIKHGNLNDPSTPATFHIEIIDDCLTIETLNLIGSPDQPKDSDGKGLKNILQRLKYAYSDNAQFTFGVTGEGFFQTTITIRVAALNKRPASSDTLTSIDITMLHERADKNEIID